MFCFPTDDRLWEEPLSKLNTVRSREEVLLDLLRIVYLDLKLQTLGIELRSQP